jgi:hypothetical protein
MKDWDGGAYWTEFLTQCQRGEGRQGYCACALNLVFTVHYSYSKILQYVIFLSPTHIESAYRSDKLIILETLRNNTGVQCVSGCAEHHRPCGGPEVRDPGTDILSARVDAEGRVPRGTLQRILDSSLDSVGNAH